MDRMSTTPAAVPGYSWRVAKGDGESVTVIAFKPDDDQAAGATLTFATHSTGEHRATLEGEVGAEHRRRGLGNAILAWAETATREHFAGALAAGETVTFRVDVDTAGDDAARLYERHGLSLAVAEDEMTRALDDVPNLAIPPQPSERQMCASRAIGMAIDGLVSHVETGAAWEPVQFTADSLPGEGGTRGIVIPQVGGDGPGRSRLLYWTPVHSASSRFFLIA